MITIKLADGRELALELLAPHEAMGLAEGCRQLSGVRQWWRTAMTVASIRRIDGIPMPIPTHVKHVEGLVGRFSWQDMKAVLEALENYPSDEAAPELELRELTPLETLRIWAMVGEYETIPAWVNLAFAAAAVRKIGDEKITLPTSKAEMKALVAQLGLAGMSKASVFMMAQGRAEKDAEAEQQAAAKN